MGLARAFAAPTRPPCAGARPARAGARPRRGGAGPVGVCCLIGGRGHDGDEAFVEAHVMLSVASALASPDSEKWQSAIDKEEARLLAFETWEPATDEQVATADRILPIAIILTVKRCGTFKARAVVLGHLDRSGTVDTFAPVVAHGANRLLVTQACIDQDEILAADLDSAFLNALLNRDLFFRLPKIWQEKHTCEIVKLKKALYGLRESPKA